MTTESTETSIESLRKEAAAYSVHDNQYAKNPFGLWKRLQESPELLRSEQDGGFWILNRFEDARRAGTDEQTYAARFGRALPAHPEGLLPSDADGPLHRQYRKILNPWMTEAAMAYMEPVFRSTCAELLDPLTGKTEIDFASEFSGPLTVISGMTWLDWPAEDHKKFGHWAHNILIPGSEDEQTTLNAWNGLSEFIQADMERRRGENRDDVIGAILTAEVDGRPITDKEALQLIISIFLGAVDTTGSTLNSALYWLAHNPDGRDRLRSEPDLMVPAVEEFLRVAGTLAYTARTVMEDVEIRGCPVKKGDRVALLYAAANRDADEFPNPEEVVLDRKPNRHLAFGAGAHKCAGAPFARMLLRIAIEQTLQRLGDFEVVDEDAVRWAMAQVRVCDALPVVHHPR